MAEVSPAARRPPEGWPEVPEHGPIYFYSYAYHNDSHGQLRIESAVTRKHPLLIVKEWHNDYNGNNYCQLISYQTITGLEQVGNLKLQSYLDFSLTENYGELHATPEDMA